MSSIFQHDTERLVTSLKNDDPVTFEKYVRSRITQIVNLEVLEDFLSPECKKTNKPVEWWKEKRKERSKKKTGKCGHDGGVIGGLFTPVSVRKVKILIDFLNLPKCLCEEGLFRKSGNVIRQKKIEEAFNDSEEKLHSQLQEELISPHDVAGVLKLFFRELPEPLLTSKPESVYKQLADFIDSPAKILECIQLLLQLLPKDNCLVVKYLMQLLHNTSRTPGSKMTSKTLGTIFAPHILSCRPMDAQSMKVQAESGNTALVMAFMIENVHKLFKLPEMLIQSIKIHYQNQEPGHLNEDQQKQLHGQNEPRDKPLQLNTRYTFTQKEVHESNDFQAVEIAKLQAIIASMPNSSKQKKKYIKRIVQTPNLYQSTSKESHKRSKSVSSAFKKLMGKNLVHEKHCTSHDESSDILRTSYKTMDHSITDKHSHILASALEYSPLINCQSNWNIISTESSPWTPVTKLFLDDYDCINLSGEITESPSKQVDHRPKMKELSYDPSRVLVVEHHKGKRKEKLQLEKARIVTLKSPGKVKSNSAQNLTDIEYHTPKTEYPIIADSCEFPIKYRLRRSSNTPTGKAVDNSYQIHTPLLKSTVKRKVPVEHSVNRSVSPGEFVPKRSPRLQGLNASPLTKTLENVTLNVKKAGRTPRVRTPVAAL